MKIIIHFKEFEDVTFTDIISYTIEKDSDFIKLIRGKLDKEQPIGRGYAYQWKITTFLNKNDIVSFEVVEGDIINE